jgi:hypothetical protein
MIFCHKPYNPNNTNLNKKKALVIYALNPKNYTNYIMQKKKKKKKKKKKQKKKKKKKPKVGR